MKYSRHIFVIFCLVSLACQTGLPTDSGSEKEKPVQERSTVELAGRLQESVTLQDSVLYLLKGDLIIPRGVTVHIPAGAMILATGVYEIFVQGRLLCKGTEEKPVRFGVRMDETSDEQHWKGIRLQQAEGTNIFHYVHIREAVFGILSTGSTVEISNSRFTGNLIAVDAIKNSVLAIRTTVFDSLENQGVVIKTGTPAYIDSSVFSEISGIAIECDASPLELTNSTFQNVDWGLRLISSPRSLIRKNTFLSGVYGLNIGSSDSVQIMENTISDLAVGIFLFNLSYRTVQMNRNNIDNPRWNLFLQNVNHSTIDARECWWGSAVEDSIAKKIHDGIDVTPLDTVLVMPIRTSEIIF